MKSTSASFVINCFAVLHAATALLCRLVGWDDSLLLTLMTMLMTAWLCLMRGYSLEISAVCVILVNVVGFALGTGFAQLLALFTAPNIITHPLSTFLTTEILGWGIFFLTKIFRDPEKSGATWNTSVKWLLIAFFAILIFRYGYLALFSVLYDSTDAFSDTFFSLFTNALVILVLVCANIIYVRTSRKKQNTTRGLSITVFTVFALLISALAAVLGAYNLPFGHGAQVSLRSLTGTYLIALILDLTIYSIIYIMDYATAAARERDRARMRTQEVTYQYNKLKQQISPHFFFNSLNVLDCIVCDNQNELASEYIHKLAGIYRYMLGRGEEETVMLSDEMKFVGMYVDLMKLRFGKGLVVNIEIDEGLLGRAVVPCSVQLLVENVCKHNATSQECPMVVDITASGDYLTVRNDFRPKLTPSTDGGHGLTYIRKIYENLCGRPVIVNQTAADYIVSLPLM